MKSDYAWNLSDLDKIPKTGVKVMSTFSCGGGSSMGYKLAGCDVIAANDCDPDMAYHYKLNLNPSYYFLCPIQELITMELPEFLYNLDILDGSPPCSTFSTAGNREKDWGKNKRFREGQTKQVLSDLFFDYLALVEKLRPKVAIAENVKGMIKGNAKGYTKAVLRRFKEIGYKPQLFLVNAADCGVPQRRERVFFVAIREDIELPPLKLAPQSRWISAYQATKDLVMTDEEVEETAPTLTLNRFWAGTKPGQIFEHEVKRQRNGKGGCFNYIRLHRDKPSNTLTSVPNCLTHWNECRRLTFREWKRLGAFPEDYQAKTTNLGKYIVGMSVPPRMTEKIARAVCEQWLGVNYASD